VHRSHTPQAGSHLQGPQSTVCWQLLDTRPHWPAHVSLTGWGRHVFPFFLPLPLPFRRRPLPCLCRFLRRLRRPWASVSPSSRRPSNPPSRGRVASPASRGRRDPGAARARSSRSMNRSFISIPLWQRCPGYGHGSSCRVQAVRAPSMRGEWPRAKPVMYGLMYGDLRTDRGQAPGRRVFRGVSGTPGGRPGALPGVTGGGFRLERLFYNCLYQPTCVSISTRK
jgi:hypothetical protein